MSGSKTDLLLFVAGEPDSGVNSTRASRGGLVARVAGMFMPMATSVGPGGGPKRTSKLEPAPLTETRPWHLPPQQVACVNMVLEIAEKLGRTVVVVDVDRAEERQDLVNRWVGPEDVIPILVRHDGSRLEGAEEFVPSRIRQFIRGR